MSTDGTSEATAAPTAPEPADNVPSRPFGVGTGWRTVAAKEFADHFRSVRFYVLLVLVVLAAVAAEQSAAGALRSAAPAASEVPAVFLRLFTAAPRRIPSYYSLVGFIAPLLGVAFGFDAVNAERAQGTLPRLVSQPIHRDDIINGKFAAGLGIIGLTLTLLTVLVTGFGLFRLGIAPGLGDVARLVAYLVVLCAYVGVWLALAILCSVLLRRAATSALVAISAWLVFTFFWGLLAGLVADGLASAPDNATFDQSLRNARMELTVSRLSPQTLYEEATGALLNPQVRSVGLVLPDQTDQAIPGTLPLTQSLLVVWPQITALIAVSLGLFAAAYVAFMTQEIRA